MKVGLFFGSFNPLHTGHMIIANLVLELSSCTEVWFIVTPQNPHKKSKNLLHDFDRLDMVRAAVYDNYHFRAIDVEFNLPKPSYTIHTLTYLAEMHPDKDFRLIIGEDNLASFPRWKNYEEILNGFGLIVYPRPNAKKSNLLDNEKVTRIEAPEMDISATLIRKLVKSGKSIKYLVPEEVRELIEAKNFYK
jgi:nicotinate-nucleotide adenylyltransferase